MSECNVLFEGSSDRYQGITVDSIKEPCEVKELLKKLSESLEKWKTDNRRCIWFKVNIKDADWVPILANNGFNFHHASDGWVVMYKWLPTATKPNLPPACHTNLGVGGLVLNEKNEILVVTEQHFDYPHWKLPGGYVEREEDIKSAAIREVKEETGIDAVFESMVSLRHTHNMMFGNSDIYFVVMMSALTNKIMKSDIEIKECKWMNVDEFLNHPNVHEFNRFIVRQALDVKKRNLKLNLHKETVNISTWSREITSFVIEDL